MASWRPPPRAGTSTTPGPDDTDRADTPGGAGGGGGRDSNNGGGSDNSASAFDPTGSLADGSGGPAEEQKKRQIARVEAERQIGDRAFDPRDGASINVGNTSNGLPLPVLLALIALTVLLAAGALLAVHQRNPAFMGALRRVPLPRRRR